jgi:hypothetical protein
MSIDVIAARLHNQRLTASTLRRPEDVVTWLGAVQAQDYAGARWATGQRMLDATDASIEQAFDAGRILRTHILRPTWHFVAPADLRWMLALSAPRVHRANGFAYRSSSLTPKSVAKGADVICRALEGHQHLTRVELAAHLRRARLPDTGVALAYIVMHAELEGLICSGPRRGKQFTYALIDERVPPGARLDAGEALVALTRRYFTSHGPATLRDFVWWSGLTMAQARSGLATLGGTIETAEIDGRRHWWAGDASPSTSRGHSMYLLPNYDEFLIAFKDRQWSASATTLAPRFGPAMQHPHQVVSDGRVEGSWRRTLRPSGTVVDVVPYRRLTRGERAALTVAADRFAAYLEMPVTLTVAAPVGASEAWPRPLNCAR